MMAVFAFLDITILLNPHFSIDKSQAKVFAIRERVLFVSLSSSGVLPTW